MNSRVGKRIEGAGRGRTEEPVQAFRAALKNPRSVLLLLLGVTVLVMPAAGASGGGAKVSGVVRDGSGVTQMGALVQVLAANSQTVGTAFTDVRGRYVISSLHPGNYVVRASQSLCVPATRSNLQLRAGAVAVVNLTLASLFDTTAWLPAERRRTDEPKDDWNWTLRSSANRPILRLVDDAAVTDGYGIEGTETTADGRTRITTSVTGGSGFGEAGTHSVSSIHRSLGGGVNLMLRADVAVAPVQGMSMASKEFEAGYERQTGFGQTSRVVVSYRNHPELGGVGVAGGLQVFSMSSAERMNVGGALELEAGGSLLGARGAEAAVAAHPFVRVTAQPNGVWTLRYRMATDRQMQGLDDVTAEQSEVPVAIVRNGRLTFEKGQHHEVSVSHRGERAVVQLAYYHDALQQTAVSGGGVSAVPAVPGGMLVDTTTGTFRTLAAGLTANGLRLTVTAPLTSEIWIAAEYSSGEALGAGALGLGQDRPSVFEDAVGGLRARSAQAATVALKGRLVGGAQFRTSYRWQTGGLVSAVDSYSGYAEQGYLSCRLRQPLHVGHVLPEGLDATIDVTNLLAQGYRPFLSADGQTLYFAQSPRTLQAGLSFTF